VPEDNQGFQISENTSFFDHLFSFLAPETLLELGTWKGSSVIGFVKRMLAYCDAPVVACVDTWVGSLEHWTNTALRAEMHLRWGFPTLYSRFAANVVRARVAGWITPLPMLTETALQLMAQRAVLIDAVYVDASHEYEAVKRDISNCWSLIDETGFILADDYLAPGVMRAIQEFCGRDGVFGMYNKDSSWPQALLVKESQLATRVLDTIPGVSAI
jgi:predicted O-methyltransferase YrrM